MKEFFIPVVVIKTQNTYYLYPKKRGKTQKLIELDEVGYYFWKICNEYDDIDVIKKLVCKKYNVVGNDSEMQVLNDVINFKQTLRESGFLKSSLIDSSDSIPIEGILNNVSEISFIEQFGKMQRYFTENRKPFKFFIELTYNCNLRCKHCYRGEDVAEKNNKVYLDKERLFKLFDEIESIGAVEVIITGGEPFLHPDIYEILEYATKKNLIITVLSNGNFLNDPKYVRLLEDLSLFDIRISVYGLEDKHDAMTHVKGSFNKSIEALKNIHNILGVGTAAFVVTKENYEDNKILIEKLKSNDINVAVNSSITPTAKGSQHPLELRISEEQYTKMVEMFNLPLSGTMCTAGISRFRINPSGDISPCELIPEYSFGNIYQQALENIMESKERKDFIEMFETILERHVCNECKYRTECNFCPALFLQENGSFLTPSKYLCNITECKHDILVKRGIYDTAAK